MPFVLTTTHSRFMPDCDRGIAICSKIYCTVTTHYQSRIVNWKGAGHVYYFDKIYITNERPYCHVQNPHNEGMSTLLQHFRCL